MIAPYTTLVDAPTLASHLSSPGWLVVDCRFSLRDPVAGRVAWRLATVPKAEYAHLDSDLSGPVVAGKTGRHPLPKPEAFAGTLRRWGVDVGTQIVAFDDAGGAIASRLWWMCRWVGHEGAAVLDGGLAAWQAAGGALAPGVSGTRAGSFAVKPALVKIATAADVLAALPDPRVAVLDARSADRFAGKNETTDPVAGHIAGAVNAPYADNLGAEQHLASADAIAQRYGALLGDRSSGDAICYCGSGVTACHNILAMAHAGLPLPRLYPGSWSEWITDPARPRS